MATPHLNRYGLGNDAIITAGSPPALIARQGDVHIAVCGPFDRASAGYRDSSDLFIDLTSAPVRLLAPPRSVYDDVRRVLLDHGLTRGRERSRRGQLGLVGAIEAVVRETAGGSREGPRLAREARIARHLRELAGTANLGAWVDTGDRSLDDVLQLLTFAAAVYPED